jgi:hypothetical protein
LIEKKTKGKKGIFAYNTFFGTSSMKRHVKFEHLELLTSYVEKIDVANNISRSQIVGDEGSRAIQPDNKSSKVTLGAIFIFWGSKIPYILLLKQ